MISMGISMNPKQGVCPKICKLGSHYLSPEDSVLVKNHPILWKIYEYESAFWDLSGEIVKFQLSLEIKLLIFDWLKLCKLGHKTSLKIYLYMKNFKIGLLDIVYTQISVQQLWSYLQVLFTMLYFIHKSSVHNTRHARSRHASPLRKGARSGTQVLCP